MLFDLDIYFLLKFFKFLQFKNNSFVPAILQYGTNVSRTEL